MHGRDLWRTAIPARADHVGFALRAAGEAVGISTATGTLIDGYAFAPQQTGVFRRPLPDGSTNVVRFPAPPRRASRTIRWLTSVVINEALTHTPTNTPLEDAIELTTFPINPPTWAAGG